MYPFFRLVAHTLSAYRKPKLPVDAVHSSSHICWPTDIDMFGEMNHGRILTVFDQGRFGLAARNGLLDVVLKQGWALTMAGVSVRYRRRILPFRRYEMRSKFWGLDDRFLYLEQSMWRNGECCASALYRTTALRSGKMVPVAEVAAALNVNPEDHPVPDWVEDWAQADAKRPWPPLS